jgi:AcrR family transcriptional regulator
MTPPSPPRTKEQLVKEFRTGEILRAARQVVAELGLGEASMERIAQGAGISKGTIYLYFQNKEQLLLRAVQQVFDELMANLERAVANAKTAPARLGALLETSLEHASANSGFFRALMEPRGVGAEGVSELARRFAEQNERYVAFVAALVEQGARSGELRDLPTRVAAVALAGALRGAIAERLSRGPSSHAAKDSEVILDLLLNGVIGKR